MKPLSFSILVFSAFFPVHVQAGFEWIPSTEPEIIVPPPPPPVSVIPTVLPAPSIIAAPPSVVQTAPPPAAIPAVTPITVEPPPMQPVPPIGTQPIPLQPIEFDTPGVAAQPVPLAPMASSAPLPPVFEENQPVYQDIMLPPQDRVVVADDAPMRVENSFENVSRLRIEAFPTSQDLVAAPVVAPPQYFPGATGAPPPPMMPVFGFDVHEGFGSDVPLALALTQIVPAQFAYNFVGNVDPGVRISWSGGKPWNAVLQEALAPLGYGIFVRGQTVMIGAYPRG